MALLRRDFRVHLLVFTEPVDQSWLLQLREAGLQVALEPVNGHAPRFGRRQTLLYLNPGFEQFEQQDTALSRLLAAGYKRQFLLTDDPRWKQRYPNGNPRVLPQHTHPLELARLLVEQGYAL